MVCEGASPDVKLFEQSDFARAALRATGNLRSLAPRPAIAEDDRDVTKALSIAQVTGESFNLLVRKP
jgi:hypothetical protein